MELRPDDLYKLARMTMPFGKYRGRLLIDLPEPYVEWLHQQGIAQTEQQNEELGNLLAQLYEIKLNGLEYLITPLKIKEGH